VSSGRRGKGDEAAAASGAPSTDTDGERATAWLRKEIVTGRLPPNQKLSQRQLARELGVSSIPMREAPWTLKAEGFLTASQRGATMVAPMNRTELQGITDLQFMLVPALATEVQVGSIPAGSTGSLGPTGRRRDNTFSRCCATTWNAIRWPTAPSISTSAARSTADCSPISSGTAVPESPTAGPSRLAGWLVRLGASSAARRAERLLWT
jgi:hypothetical protein